ncbi:MULTISPECIES: DUF4845 domain-containing protein [Marinobacter]|jgi:hypothetical protein|uniref:DUF4845 domain-containing protein n=1 Tax=Marinobacter segnicrescens TaxID=430453 RepID=A0A1I0F280_9GAMM|nr:MULTISPECIES: DUF4845 domain-containing protein [Marinobacter]UZD64792.1 DUF4845 domain-containing protein [Marinobacter sp. AN1]SET51106.1 protein of unknown function [Marinobacter segnicrescens]
MNQYFQQRGASTLGILIAVLFFASLLTLVIKLGPAYLDDYTVQGALEGLDGEEGLSQMTPADVRRLVTKRLSVNNVDGFNAKDIQIEKDGDIVVISLDYEVRTHVVYNVDAVISFSHFYELTGQ